MDPFLQFLMTLPQVPGATEIANWENQRRQLGTGLGNATAQLGFDRGNILSNQGQATQDLTTQYDRMRQSIPGGFAHRGLLNSGIYGHALKTYGEDRTNAFSKMQQQYGQQLGQNTLSGQQAQSTYTSGMAGVAGNEAARRQELASAIRGL